MIDNPLVIHERLPTGDLQMLAFEWNEEIFSFNQPYAYDFSRVDPSVGTHAALHFSLS